jgi:hypothetical protein
MVVLYSPEPAPVTMAVLEATEKDAMVEVGLYS